MNTKSTTLKSSTTKVHIPPSYHLLLPLPYLSSLSPISNLPIRQARLISHMADTREEDLTHPEDIEHFRKHDEMDAAAARQAQLDKMQIVEMNIPDKFRRH